MRPNNGANKPEAVVLERLLICHSEVRFSSMCTPKEFGTHLFSWEEKDTER